MAGRRFCFVVVFILLTALAPLAQGASPSSKSSSQTTIGAMSPTLSSLKYGGDAPVEGSNETTHFGYPNDFYEGKMLVNSTIWYVHIDMALIATTATWDPSHTVLTLNNSAATLVFDTETSAQTIIVNNVSKIPGSSNYKNVQDGDVWELGPYLQEQGKAFWYNGGKPAGTGTGLSVQGGYVVDGEAKLTRHSQVTEGVGNFFRFWGNLSDLNQVNLESSWDIVTTGFTLHLVEVVSGSHEIQDGGILLLSNGTYEDLGFSMGEPAYSVIPDSNCQSFSFDVSTSWGELSGTLNIKDYFGTGCSFEDGTLSGSLNLGGQTYTVTGTDMEYRNGSAALAAGPRWTSVYLGVAVGVALVVVILVGYLVVRHRTHGSAGVSKLGRAFEHQTR